MVKLRAVWRVAAALALLVEGSPASTFASDGASATGDLDKGLAAFRASDYALAEKAFGAVRGRDRPAARLELARLLFETGRFADAERTAKEVTAPDVDLAAIALRGEILAAQGKTEEARSLLDPYRDRPGSGGRRVRLALGEILLRMGRRADAEPLLEKFADDYDNDVIASTDAEGLAMVGRAMHLLRLPKDANRAFNESERTERGRVETLLWRADLFIDKFDPGHAEEVLLEALKIGPHRPDALVSLARVKLEESLDFSAAEKMATQALAVDPNHAGAFAVLAGIALRDGDMDKAREVIEHGLAIDPGDLELLSLRAARRYLAGDGPGFESAKAEIFARDKEFSHAYGIIGEFAEWEHRYSDVVGMMQKAVAIDADDAKAWAELGLMQTRAGDESGGIKSLEVAWQHDHFNVRVYNTLQLLYRKWVPQEYESAKAGVFEVRYPKTERPILERYVPRLLGEAWAAMKVHYLFAPETPVAVEMYKDREQFSVRTSGLPNVGIQGVCFGKVVAAMSPASEPFNWGNVLWHELAHVFAIRLSDSHVPRWFTEGLSEYETMIRRPEWRRELDPELYLALKKGRLPGVLTMNTAFTHADDDLDVTVAYYAASEMVAFAGERFGFPAIVRALRLWGSGQTTPDVFRNAFGLTASEFDAAFRAWSTKRLQRYDGTYAFERRGGSLDDARARVQAHTDDVEAHVSYAVALLREHEEDDAKREIDLALNLDPRNPDAHFVGYRIALDAHEWDAAGGHLEAMKAAGAKGYTMALSAAELAKARRDRAAERSALEAAHRYDPSQPEPLRDLYELANADGRDGDSLAILRELAPLDQHDRRVWGLLLHKLVAAGLWEEARRTGEAALFVDVENATVHGDYARALSAVGDHAGAVFELESALLSNPKPEEEAAIRALLTKERAALAGVSQAER